MAHPLALPAPVPGPPRRRRRPRASAALPVVLAAAAAACQGPQSALDPAGPAAREVAVLWWALLAVATAVSLAVFAGLVHALRRRRRFPGRRPAYRLAPQSEEELRREGQTVEHPEARGSDDPAAVWMETADSDRRAVRWVVGLGVGLTGAILAATLLATLVTLGRTHASEPADLTIRVTGWQWWWEVEYLDEAGGVRFETANEIHVPAGRRVRVRLEAADVIHSFWVPRLAGKLDMIPGRTTQFWIRADTPGVYRGQCAEYCAGPHALMSMLVVAQPEEEFRAWAARQAEPAADPRAAPADSAGHPHPGGGHADPGLLLLGRDVFLRSDCVDCHTVRGTPADGRTGPDLTHLASRRTLAAVVVPNTRGHLGGWITSPQEVKPGSKMPAVPLAPDELHALLHYLQSLK